MLKRQSKGLFSSSKKDEELWEEILRNISHEEVEIEYKMLRKCFENIGRHNEAAYLFQREMLLMKEDLKWRENPAEKAAHYIYNTLSYYGESLNRPVALFIISIFGYSLLFTIFIYASKVSISNYFDVFTKVLAVSFQLNSFKDLGVEVPLVWEILTRFTSLLLIGNIYIAIKRRLERK